MKYNLEYYDNLLRQYTRTAEYIVGIRWEFVKEVCPRTVLDYGCGVAWFRAFKPEGIKVDTYDIGPYPQTGIRQTQYDLLCLWDVLEHFKTREEIERVIQFSDHIALTIPLLHQGQRVEEWKHFKPGEHYQYYTLEGLHSLFDNLGFYPIKQAQPECPPRVDIWSIIYQRRTK